MLGRSRLFAWSGTILWILLFAVVAIIAAADSETRSVVPAYRLGSERFFAGQPLYDLSSLAGYIYAPAFAVIFAPFWLAGPLVGGLLWRAIGFAVLSFAAVLQVRRITDEGRTWIRSCAFFIAIPLVAGALRNGQATILESGAVWLAVIAAVPPRTLALAWWSMIALLAKPVSVAGLMLIGGTYPRLILTILSALLFLLGLPFLFAPADYAWSTHVQFGELLWSMTETREAVFMRADYTTLLSQLGITLSHYVDLAVRAVAGLLTFLAALHASRSMQPQRALQAIAVLAVFYISLFNPRQEGNTYAVLALPFAVVVAEMLYRRERLVVAWLLGVLVFAAGLGGIEPRVLDVTEYWLQPLFATAAFVGIAGHLYWPPASRRSAFWRN